MTFFELVKGNNQAGHNSFAFIPGADSNGTATYRSNNYSFESILNSSKSKNWQEAASLAGQHRSRGSGPGSETGENSGVTGFVSFREARDYSAKESSGAVGGKEAAKYASPDEELDNDACNTKKGAGQSAAGSILGITAQLLDIGTDDLQRLLNMADTASWHVNGIMRTEEMVSYLSQALGLNGEQQDTLEELLMMAAESLELLTGNSAAVQEGILEENMEAVSEGAAFNDAPGSVASTENGISVEADIESFIEKLSERIRMKLDEYGIRLAVDQGKAKEEIKAKMMLAAENPGVRAKLKLQQDRAKNETAENVSAQTAEEAEKKPANTEDDGGMDMPAGDMSGDNAAGLKMADGSEFQTAVQLPPVNPAWENPGAIAGKTTETIIQPRDIINQVIEKVKVVLTPEKSEIAMELKPDSLGRVSLRVAAENGLVMARFVTESQQVKQVLEANMQVLKDSLERQGINVQGFSVSVRQESDRYQGNKPGPEKNGRKASGGKAYAGLSIEADIPELTGVLAARNPYLWNYSTIDLTA